MKTKIDKQAVGQRIKKIRLDKGMTLEEFGKLFGASFGNVKSWEMGMALPNASRINTICKIANITRNELLYGEEKKNNEITLAEFLGWEEDTEYELDDKIYVIKCDVLYVNVGDENGFFVDELCPLCIFKELRQAEKLKLKKYYLRHKYLDGEEHNYLNLKTEKNKLFLSDGFSGDDFQTQFTAEEIEKIVKEYGLNLDEFIKVEVEED